MQLVQMGRLRHDRRLRQSGLVNRGVFEFPIRRAVRPGLRERTLQMVGVLGHEFGQSTCRLQFVRLPFAAQSPESWAANVAKCFASNLLTGRK